jgi:hypothetical protein
MRGAGGDWGSVVVMNGGLQIASFRVLLTGGGDLKTCRRQGRCYIVQNSFVNHSRFMAFF